MERRSRQPKCRWLAAPSSSSGSCTAPAPPLCKLIKWMSLHTHEKFISFSGLVNLELSSAANAKGKILKPGSWVGREGERPRADTQTHGEETRAPSMLCHQPFCIILGKLFTPASAMASAHYSSFSQRKVKAVSNNSFSSVTGYFWYQSKILRTPPRMLCSHGDTAPTPVYHQRQHRANLSDSKGTKVRHNCWVQGHPTNI